MSRRRALARAHEDGIVTAISSHRMVFVTDRGQVRCSTSASHVSLITHKSRSRARPSSGRGRARGRSGRSREFRRDRRHGAVHVAEQWRPDVVDHLSDIWAFGIMFWRASRMPPAGTLASRHCSFRLRDSTRRCRASRRAARTSARARGDRRPLLELRKANRYQTAGELLADLQLFSCRSGSRLREVWSVSLPRAIGEDDAKYFSAAATRSAPPWRSSTLAAARGRRAVGRRQVVVRARRVVPAVRAHAATGTCSCFGPAACDHRLAGILDDTLGTGEVSNDLIELSSSRRRIRRALRRWSHQRSRRTLVVVDQLGSCSRCATAIACARCSLPRCSPPPTSDVAGARRLVEWRADFLDRLAGHKQFLAEAVARAVLLDRTRSRQPARDSRAAPPSSPVTRSKDPWIVEDMMQAATSRGALPLLSFAASGCGTRATASASC